MNMFARFDENPAMTLQVIKETKRYGRTDNVKTVYPLQTKFAGGIMNTLKIITKTGRGVEIVKFSTCPGTSKKPKCTCP